MKFEDLDVWKRTARLSANIYKELSHIKDFGFKDQITRSGLSIPSNIAFILSAPCSLTTAPCERLQ
ncbi:MAG TPA: four helix bundle protein [Nitrospirae bacterium]|nr:four helix bundle protein [Nitrospirota bacterium]HDZ01930.1 four helix bundle protein [Nitrospirota bacterium]